MSTNPWADTRKRLVALADAPLELMREALAICEENLDAVRDVTSSAEKSGLVRLGVDAAAREIAGYPEQVLWPYEDAGALVGKLFDTATSFVGDFNEPAVAARVVAGALDQRFADSLAAEVARGTKLVTLQDGDLVTAPNADIFGVLGGKNGPSLGPRTAYRADLSIEPAKTPRFSLFHLPAACTLAVEVDPTRTSNLLAALVGVPTAATVHPVGDGDHVAEEDWVRVGDGVFGIGPLDGDAVWEQTVAMLKDAASQGARIAVVPELNVGGNVVPSLVGQTVPPLVLSGSRHVMVDGSPVNQAVLHLNGARVLTHRKVVPFAEVGTTEPTHREAVDAGNQLTVLFCGRWTVGVLICADVNSDAVMSVMQSLGVNLLLVSSMTRAIGYFEARLSNLVLDNQGLAVWSNDPVDQVDMETSAFFFPREYGQMESYVESLPCVYVHQWPPPGSPPGKGTGSARQKP